LVLAAAADGVLTLTLNRPHVRNAIDAETWQLLGELVGKASADDEVRAVVLTGQGGNFSSGADISGMPAGHPLGRLRGIGRVAEALWSCPKPVAAKVEGWAVGAGWSLALCCDLVVASATARFSAVFAKRGLSPDVGATWLLPRLAGLQQAKRLAFLADVIDAEEARSLGLVTWVKAPDEIGEFTADLARRLAAMPPVVLAQTKDLLNAGVTQAFRTSLDEEMRAQSVNYATTDAVAAREAFRAKTEPRFTGTWAL
jgi:2-(1,2-epoxy-1,2-dihydrophenyl)acetyl-CoA isomerase